MKKHKLPINLSFDEINLIELIQNYKIFAFEKPIINIIQQIKKAFTDYRCIKGIDIERKMFESHLNNTLNLNQVKDREEVMFEVQDIILKNQSIKINFLQNNEKAIKFEKQGKFDFYGALSPENLPQDPKKQKIV